MTSTDIRVRGIAELIATVPLQMGYRPEHSLVLVLLGDLDGGSATARAAGRLKLICRLDLPEGAGELEDVLEAIHGIVWQHRPAVVEVIAYEGERDVSAVLEAVASVCAAHGVRVDQLARVRGERWLALRNGRQARGVWRDLPAVDRVPAAADLVWHGACEGLRREEVIAAIRGADTARQALLAAEVEAYGTRFLDALAADPGCDGGGAPSPNSAEAQALPARFLERAAVAWRRLLDTTPEGPAVADLPPAVVAQGLVLLWDRGFRDALIAWVAPGQLGPGLLPPDVLHAFVRHLPVSRWRDRARLDRLVDLCGLTADDVAAPVLTVTGQVAWASNQGTLANIAIGRALQVAPDYQLARLTDELLQRAVPPPPGPFAEAG